jgi:hypothetical protein
MTAKGIAIVREAIRAVYEKNPELLAPIEDHYQVNLADRITNDRYWVP